MAISRLPKDAKELSQQFTILLDALHRCAREGVSLKLRVQAAADLMADREMSRILRQIPVEALNRDKRGIRVTTLKNNGYENLNQICGASAGELAALEGISPQGAGEILALAGALQKQLKKDVKIRLSLDDPSAEAGALMDALMDYQPVQDLAAAASGLLGKYEQLLRRDMQSISACGGSIRWLFTGREKKERAWQAYSHLKALQAEDILAQGQKLISSLEAYSLKTDGRKAFGENPIPFVTALEQVCPGLLGSGDSQYGLPRELADQVEQEQYSLDGLACQLRSYQQWGVRFILHQKQVLLGDEMGLGKTVQAIAAMVALRNRGQSHFIVICPASVIENWCREIRKHSNLSVTKLHGEDRQQAFREWEITGGVAVTNYESCACMALSENFQIAMVVVDEAHYIKNPQAQRTQRVKKICSRADRRLFMTGTAMENRVDEMIRLIAMLRPEVAREAEKMAALSAAPKFQQVVAPVYYRRRREDVLQELPELIEKQQWCVLGRNERAIYEAAVLDGNYAQARRVSWSAERPEDSCKAHRLLEILEQAAAQGRKVIVFSFFLNTIEKIRSLLGDRCLEPINGSVSPQRRQQIVDAFHKAPAGTVLAAQIQAGGTGLNIQSASVVVLCEPQLKPSLETQAISRAYRMGQTRNVLVFRLLCEDSVDEEITRLLQRKQLEFNAYADESLSGRESLELDEAGFHSLMQQEAARIQKARQQAQS